MMHNQALNAEPLIGVLWMTPFQSTEVATKFDSYPSSVRQELLRLRELIFKVSQSTPEVGEIEETLKWGEPAYLTKSGSGSTIRMDWKAKKPHEYALYFNCNTTLVETFMTLFPNDFVFEGNRALVFTMGSSPRQDALRFCLSAALTYNSTKRRHDMAAEG